MKKHFLSILFCFVIINVAEAQLNKEKNEKKATFEMPIQKGCLMLNINGGLSFMNQNYTIPANYNAYYGATSYSVKGVQISSDVSIGCFLVKHFMLGINLSNTYSYSTLTFHSSVNTFTNGNSTSTSGQTISVSPIMRYYFPIAKKTALYPEFDFGIVSDSRTSSKGALSRSATFVYRAGLGLNQFINKNVAFSIGGYYTIQSLSSKASTNVIYDSKNNRVPQLLYGFQLFF
jgi:hypothetical protein